MNQKWTKRKHPNYHAPCLEQRGLGVTVVFHPYYAEHEELADKKANEFLSTLNALAGVEDVEGFMDCAKELLKEMEWMVEHIDADHMPESYYRVKNLLAKAPALFPTEKVDPTDQPPTIGAY